MPKRPVDSSKPSTLWDGIRWSMYACAALIVTWSVARLLLSPSQGGGQQLNTVDGDNLLVRGVGLEYPPSPSTSIHHTHRAPGSSPWGSSAAVLVTYVSAIEEQSSLASTGMFLSSLHALQPAAQVFVFSHDSQVLRLAREAGLYGRPVSQATVGGSDQRPSAFEMLKEAQQATGLESNPAFFGVLEERTALADPRGMLDTLVTVAARARAGQLPAAVALVGRARRMAGAGQAAKELLQGLLSYSRGSDEWLHWH